MDEAASLDGPLPYGGIADVPASESDFSDVDAARLARERYRTGIPVLEPDEVVAPHLEGGEQLLDFCVPASVRSMDGLTSTSADEERMLYVTDRRVLLVGARTTWFPLSAIAELTVTTRSLLVELSGSGGMILDVAQPRRLRALIVAAMRASRR